MERSGLVMKGRLCAIVALLAVTIAVAGCGSNGSGSPGDSGSLISLDKQHLQKVYVIGEIKEPSTTTSTQVTTQVGAVKGPAEAAKQVFVNRVPYDGVSSDAPVFIAADQIASLSGTMKQGLLATYRKSFPIILIRGGETEINTLLEILERVPNYKLPKNYPYAELFAVSTELVGNFSLSIYPPGSSDSSSTPGTSSGDNTSGLLARADALRSWIAKSGTRTMSKALADSRANATKAANEISKSDLTELAQAEHDEKMFTDSDNNTYKFIYTMYPFHQFTTSDGKEYDWLYIEQEGILSAEPYYAKLGGNHSCTDIDKLTYVMDHQTKQLPAYSNYCTNSIDMYRITNKITDITSGFGLQGGSSPSTTNEKTTTTSGISFDLSGDFGLKGNAKYAQKDGPEAGVEVSATVKGGVSISTEKTFETYDCTVENISGNEAPAWQYKFTRPTQYGWYAVLCMLNEPVKLSRSTFQPIQKWIWRFSPEFRENKQNFTTKLEVDKLTSMANVSIFWIPVGDPYYSKYTSSFDYSPALYYAPVIVAPAKNLNLDKKAQYKTQEVSVGREWSATCDQDWCQAVPTTGKGDNPQFSVTVSENTTGKERKATITFKTSDYKGSTADNKYKLDRMYVTQAPL